MSERAADARGEGRAAWTARASYTAATWRSIAGLAAWAAHFGFVYAWTAVVCARAPVGREVLGMSLVRFGILAATAVALAVTIVVLAGGLRLLRSPRARGPEGGPPSLDRFFDWLAVTSAAFGALGILWTGSAVLAGDCGVREAAAAPARSLASVQTSSAEAR